MSHDVATAIRVSDVSFAYDRRQPVLHSLSLSVTPQQLCGLLGPNGSGKTTLFRILATLLPVQSGQIELAGFDLRTQPARVRQAIGVTFQSPALDPRLSVQQNLSCHGAIYGLSRQEIASRSAALLETFRLSDRSRTLAGQLSGGQKRRVELARGLMHEPAILLLDEPTSGLDVRSRHEFFELLRGYCQASGTTVVLATHLMEEAELCDQLVLLNHGHHVASGSPADLKASLQGDRLTVHCHHRDAVERFCRESLGCELTVRSADELSGRVSGAGDKVQRLLAECKAHIESVYVSRPTLEDVFLDLTGAPLHPQETQL